MECSTIDATVESVAPGALHLVDTLKDDAAGHLRAAEDACEELKEHSKIIPL